ncbi:uncharacterized protein LOC125062752 [Pieris napi]|uniref:uncharacterized protein LOC125062752 n=1 Tax=Pieris napi TaxID=78633 RepID=UPI001FB8F2AE|nr:uncharacterized protein LOC125062752 [Pieris napi]
MYDKGFIKAKSDNIPEVDIFMITDFFLNDVRFNSAEVRVAKVSRSSRESYGNKAIGYVQLSRKNIICTIYLDVCHLGEHLKHFVRSCFCSIRT